MEYIAQVLNSLTILHSVGEYSFVIELTKLKAKASVELWLSTGTDPMAMRRILASEYPPLVCKHTNKEIDTSRFCVKPYECPVVITSEGMKLIVTPPVVPTTIYTYH